MLPERRKALGESWSLDKEKRLRHWWRFGRLASPRRYWTRRGLAGWLREELDRDIPTIVGIDHAFSFPLAYFEKYRLSSNWEDFLVALETKLHFPIGKQMVGCNLDRIRTWMKPEHSHLG